jgi:hypothetical protein
MFRFLRFSALLVLVALCGCSDGSGTTNNNIPAAPVLVTPSTATTSPGQSAVYTIALQSGTLPASPIVLNATGLPSGATATFNPPQVALANTAQSSSSTLTVATTSATPVGTYTLNIQGLVGTATFGVATATLTVQPAGTAQNFNLVVTPPSATVTAGTPVTFTATVTTNTTFTDPITLTVNGGGGNFLASTPSPSVLNLSSQTSASAVFTVTRVVGSTSTVPASFTITATGGGFTQTATVTVQGL